MGEEFRIANVVEAWQVNSMPVASIILKSFLALLLTISPVQNLHANSQNKTLTVAVASNFLSTAKHLASDYQKQTGVHIRLSSASSGKLTTQIEAGAPFDLFLSADIARPERLVKSGHALADSLAVYATGELVLVSRDPIKSIDDVLSGKVAVANPLTAPYGAAAKQWLEQQGAKPNLIRGENINQAWHFFELGTVDVALVARSQVQSRQEQSFHQKLLSVDSSILEQGMVILASSKSLAEAKAFHQFLLSEQAQAYITSTGYVSSKGDSDVK